MSQELTNYSFAEAADHVPNPDYSWLVPDSLSKYRYYFALLSIEHFLHCSLAARTVIFFFFDQPIACLLIFSIGMTRLAFSFFPIYIFPLDSDSLYIFIFTSLVGFF